MDSARVVEHDSGPPRRPQGRRRWIMALALTALAAPLASGSAVAVTGGTTASAGPSSAPSFRSLQQSAPGERGRHCHKGEQGSRGEDSTGSGPQL